jgi:hypothetical protein
VLATVALPVSDAHLHVGAHAPRRSEVSEAVIKDARRRQRRRQLGAAAVLVAVAVMVAAASLRTEPRAGRSESGTAGSAAAPVFPLFQKAEKCAALWNTSSQASRRSSVARLRPIMSMVVGAGVPRIDATPRCGVLVMAPNGVWYGSQTSSLKRRNVRWSPLARLADNGTAQSYNLANGDPRIVRFASTLPTGKLRLN